MEKSVEHTLKTSKRTLVKAFILLAFIIAAAFLYHIPKVNSFLRPETIGRFLEASGFWAPLVFIFIFVTSICLLFPASPLLVLGAIIFGTHLGFLYGLIGAMGGASAAFLIGRLLGRDFAASLIGERLRKYDDAVERNGFTTVFYLRLINLPFTPLNYGLSLTKVHFWDYFFGTGLGILIGIFLLTFFGGALKEIWTSGNWQGLLSFRPLLALGLFIFSLFIPKIIRKIRGAS